MHLRYSIVLFLLCPGLVRPQNPTAGLHGTVVDIADSRVPLARIAIRLEDSSLARMTSCDERGEFRVDELAPGTYRVSVTATGFADAHATVPIRVGTSEGIVVRMRPARVLETVGVALQAPSVAIQGIDVASQVHQTIITSGDLRSLPLAARSFANIAYLAPGTEPVEPSDPTKARITAVSTGGSSGLNNELSLDGADNSDDYIGGFLQSVSPDAIQEFSVRTAQEEADTGGTTGGSVLIRTRSGSNTWHGDAAFFARSAALNARFPIENPAPDPKQPFSRQNYVGTLGGPIKHDVLWFFLSDENVREKASTVYSSATMTQFEALSVLASEGLIPGVGSIDVPRSVPIPFHDDMASLRLDWKQSDDSAWFLRTSTDTYLTRNDLVAQGALPSTGLLTHNDYVNAVIGNQYLFTPSFLGRLTLSAGVLHLTQTRNSSLGFALAFPFSSTALTVSGFETFGDNQFATPITNFPSLRNQQKLQFRYDISNSSARRDLRFGVNLVHEPVLDGSFPGNNETLYQFLNNPDYYVENPDQFPIDRTAGSSTTNLGGGFNQNIQRMAVYAQGSWHVTRRTTLVSGLRYSTTRGLFLGSARSQLQNPAYSTLQALQIPLVSGAPRDDRIQFAPRLGISYALSTPRTTVLRVGFGMYYNDLAQSGWASAFQAVNTPTAPCVNPIQFPDAKEPNGCVPGSSEGGKGNLIDPSYKTPYAIHVTGGVEMELTQNWKLNSDYTHEQGVHSFRGYAYDGATNLFTPLLAQSNPRQSEVVPDIKVFHSDNRSSYNALMIHLQGNASQYFSMVANYTLASAQTWGCVLGELFDYVNGVCDPWHPFSTGDFGPSGEDVRHRFVVAGTLHMPGNLDISTLTQMESARPFTITTANGTGRISIRGSRTSLDQFRGIPFVEADLRVSRPVHHGERVAVVPFAELFNVFNRNNPGANFVTNIASLPVPSEQAQSGSVFDICANSACSSTKPLSSAKLLRVPAGALGDFFGPGTTVGIPFAAQLGMRVTF
jgi:hypothetical protein